MNTWASPKDTGRSFAAGERGRALAAPGCRRWRARREPSSRLPRWRRRNRRSSPCSARGAPTRSRAPCGRGGGAGARSTAARPRDPPRCGAIVISPITWIDGTLTSCSITPSTSASATPNRVGMPVSSTSTQHDERIASGGPVRGERVRDALAVDRVHDVEEPRRPRCLVGLQMADEMPARIRLDQLLLVRRLLHPVLADIVDAGGDGGVDVRRQQFPS